jgi:hypothetical protein
MRLSFLPGWRDKPLVAMTPAEIERMFDEKVALILAPLNVTH